MATKELLTRRVMHDFLCKAALETMEKKNADYSHGDDPFKNFRHSAYFGVAPEIGILIRLGDKFRRIETFLAVGSFKVNESVLDSLEDAINYSILCAGMLRERLLRPGTHLTRAELFALHKTLCGAAREEAAQFDATRLPETIINQIASRHELIAAWLKGHPTPALIEEMLMKIVECIGEIVCLATIMNERASATSFSDQAVTVSA